MSTRIAGISTEGAVSAVVTTQISEWKKDFTRVCDYVGFKSLLGFECSSEQHGELFISRAN
jgi:hypothetical protein